MKLFTEWLEENGACWAMGLDAGANNAVLRWARECYGPEMDRFAAAVASGDPLDKLAEIVGIKRCRGESDAALRERIDSCKESMP